MFKGEDTIDTIEIDRQWITKLVYRKINVFYTIQPKLSPLKIKNLSK